MSYLINNQQKLNELVFANRNKNYGAYAIRSSYGNTVFKALSFMILGFGSFMAIAFYLSKKAGASDNMVEQLKIDAKIYTVSVDLKKEEKPLEQSAKKTILKEPLPDKPKNSSVNFIIHDSAAVENSTLALQQKVETSFTAAAGALDGTIDGHGKKGDSTSAGSALGTAGIKADFEVDSQAEFEGGLLALLRFVSNHIKYPPYAIDEGKEGTVLVKFVVDEQGKVGSLEVMKNLGYGLDDEARRVVGMLPNFKSPAKVRGQAVKVYYQLPIRFKLR